MNQPPPTYDLNPLLKRFAGAYRRLDDLTGAPKKRRDRQQFDGIGKALCEFFTALKNDGPFWAWLGTLAQPDPAQIGAFLSGLHEFEDRQQKVYEGFKLDAMSSAELTLGLTASIEAYSPRLTGREINIPAAAAHLVLYIGKIRDVVCKDPTLKNVSIGLGAFATFGSMLGGLAAAAGLVAAGSVAAFAIPVTVGALGVGALAARIADDRRDK